MTTATESPEPRLFTPQELAAMVVLLRRCRKWSQEQLAELSGLTVRTVQRVEKGTPSSVDTRRALARAFDADDIDCFNKAQTIPTAEQVKTQQEELERNTVTVALSPTSGRMLLELAEIASADMFHAAVEIPIEAQKVFAALTDYWREFRDARELYTAVDKLDIQAEIQAYLDELAEMKLVLRTGERTVAVKARGSERMTPMKFKVAYIVLFPEAHVPNEIRTTREVDIRL